MPDFAKNGFNLNLAREFPYSRAQHSTNKKLQRITLKGNFLKSKPSIKREIDKSGAGNFTRDSEWNFKVNEDHKFESRFATMHYFMTRITFICQIPVKAESI